MEFKNYIEIIGIVGRSDRMTFGDTETINLSVVTEYAYRDKEGGSIVDFTWFNVTANAKKIPSILPDTPSRGDWVKVTGRLRTIRYTKEDGENGLAVQVVASSIEILPKTA